MTNNAKIIAEELDEVADGFENVPVIERPPKVKWGEKFQEWPMEKQLQYVMRFAEAMNHAAAKIMEERDELGRLADMKEQQIVQLKAQVEANTMMLQTEIRKMNEYRQSAQQHSATQAARIRELESDGYNS